MKLKTSKYLWFLVVCIFSSSCSARLTATSTRIADTLPPIATSTPEPAASTATPTRPPKETSTRVPNTSTAIPSSTASPTVLIPSPTWTQESTLASIADLGDTGYLIAYHRVDEKDGVEIANSSAEGGVRVYLPPAEATIKQLFWAPGGDKLYIVTTHSVVQVVVPAGIPANASATTIYSTSAELQFASFAPDGKWVALVYLPIDGVPQNEINKPHLGFLNFSNLEFTPLLFSGMSWPEGIHLTSRPWSPDSKRVVFDVQMGRDEGAWSAWDIFIASVTGSITNLTASPTVDSEVKELSAVWAPSQEKIYYYSPAPKPGIFSISSQGGRSSRLVSAALFGGSGYQQMFYPSVDGSWLFFYTDEEGQTAPTFFNLLSLKSITISPNDRFVFVYPDLPAWSPSNSQVALVCMDSRGNTSLCVFDLHAESLALITTQFVQGIMPAWSPDGKQIAVLYSSTQNGIRNVLYAVKPDGSELHRIIEVPCEPSSLSWSPVPVP